MRGSTKMSDKPITWKDDPESLREEIKKLEDEIQAGWDRVNTPCGDALDKLWKAIMPENYGDWEYAGQAYRHLLCVYKEQNDKIKELEQEVETSKDGLALLSKMYSGYEVGHRQGGNDGNKET